MNCRKIQDVLITDYIDGQLDQKHKFLIEEHLAHCLHCKEFYIITQQAVIAPFVTTAAAKPPEIIWARVREAIGAREDSEKVGTDANFVMDFLRKLVFVPTFPVFFPKPVFVFSTIVTLVLMIGILPQLMITHPTIKIDARSQMEYLSYLSGTGGDISASDSADLGTPIEKYFL
ncbi:MAG: zf-HC2 domain-containing protein [Candidatus Omnitrophica bacterium]|nr:zf-HC2 domain-containing protein [Candidatus Omnitrophota bacterium]